MNIKNILRKVDSLNEKDLFTLFQFLLNNPFIKSTCLSSILFVGIGIILSLFVTYQLFKKRYNIQYKIDKK